MLSSLVFIAGVTSIVLAKPLDISLPPLIPSIPGVTEALDTLVPPLPILQFPTPALYSPQFTARNIKPKKIGYYWTGSGDKNHKGMSRTVLFGEMTILLILNRLPDHLQSG